MSRLSFLLLPTLFTGIVQATAGIAAIHDRAGLRTFTLDFPEGFCQDLAIGASVATDGVCLTVTEILSPTQANFDVMLQSLNITTLGSYAQGDRVNVERDNGEGTADKACPADQKRTDCFHDLAKFN